MVNIMKDQILEIISEVLAVPVEKLSEELSIGDIPQWNSMAQMGMIATLEERLEIEFPIDDLFELTNIGSIIAEVEKVKNA